MIIGPLLSNRVLDKREKGKITNTSLNLVAELLYGPKAVDVLSEYVLPLTCTDGKEKAVTMLQGRYDSCVC